MMSKRIDSDISALNRNVNLCNIIFQLHLSVHGRAGWTPALRIEPFWPEIRNRFWSRCRGQHTSEIRTCSSREGQCSVLDKLRVDTSWLDRMGISETERSPLEIAGDDSRCIGLSDVASLRQGEIMYLY